MEIRPFGISQRPPMARPAADTTPQAESAAVDSTQLSQVKLPPRPPATSLLQAAGQTATRLAQDLLGALLFVSDPKPVSPEEEKLGGQRDAQNLEETFGLDHDPELNARLQRLGELAIPTQPREDMQYTFKVLDTDQVAGQCCSDGSVYISRGILRQNPDAGVLFVLGHELGHLRRGHDAQRLAWEARLENSSGLRHSLYEAKLGRFCHQAEFDADGDGAQTLKRLGYGLGDAFNFLETCQAENSFTHPGYPYRIWNIADQG
ncbi:MAG: M48 family metalloprotease [Candidatus Eremiobacteraeota bacterium]|nr:M48 family metalloprotease [Candidatus Eremiobacteraeota bacterium]